MAAELIHQKSMVARKEHQCDHCGEAIEPDTRYVRSRLAEGKTAWTQRAHGACLELWCALQGPYDDVVWELHDVLDAVAELTPERYRAISSSDPEEASRVLWLWVQAQPEVRDEERLLPGPHWFRDQALAIGVPWAPVDWARYAHAAAERFNDLITVGAEVTWFSDGSPLRPWAATQYRGVTAGPARVLSGHTAIVDLEGSPPCELWRVSPWEGV